MAALALGQHGLARPAGKTDLVLAGPVLCVVDGASAADIDVWARPDKHVGRGDDVGDGGQPGVVSGHPEGHGDVVGRVSERDREQAVYAEQQQGAPVIERWGRRISRARAAGEGRTVDIGLGAQGGDGGEDGVDIGVDAGGVWIALGGVGEPALGERETGHGRPDGAASHGRPLAGRAGETQTGVLPS